MHHSSIGSDLSMEHGLTVPFENGPIHSSYKSLVGQASHGYVKQPQAELHDCTKLHVEIPAVEFLGRVQSLLFVLSEIAHPRNHGCIKNTSQKSRNTRQRRIELCSRGQASSAVLYLIDSRYVVQWNYWT